MKKIMIIVALTMLALLIGSPPATATDKTQEFQAYEVEACWQMASSDGVEGTYEWPQTRVYGEECGAVPACGETVEFQHDTYWIRDKDDKQYLKNLKVLNSPADDAQLEPHGYYSEVVHGSECITVAAPTITQPTCENPDYTVNWVTEGPHWTGEIIEPPNSSAPNIINITANAEDGYEIQGESYWELEIQRLGDDDCDTPTPPTDGPPATPPTSDEAVLPDTGAPSNAQLAGIAGLMIAAGTALVLGARHWRRRPTITA